MEYLQHAQERFKQQTGSAATDPLRFVEDTRRPGPSIVYTATKTMTLPDHVMGEQRLITGFDEGSFVDAYRAVAGRRFCNSIARKDGMSLGCPVLRTKRAKR
ncbi:MAG: hypothetical protein HC801_06495 [Nitrospira sp.]|nr:hypothetical protein [Nitrospira sp.]